MKFVIKDKEEDFRPYSITIDIDKEEEEEELFHRLNVSGSNYASYDFSKTDYFDKLWEEIDRRRDIRLKAQGKNPEDYA